MPTYIQVTNPQNNLSWRKQLSNEELAQVRQLCKGQPTIDVFAATLQPVRTDNWENFSTDFFLPTLKNHALKVQHAVGKIFAILGALILDLITFPIRLITCIPRVITNSRKDDHPLYQYLQTNAVDLRISEKNHVWVKFVQENRGGTPGRSQFWEEKQVNFVELPEGEGSKVSSRGSSCFNVDSSKRGSSCLT